MRPIVLSLAGGGGRGGLARCGADGRAGCDRAVAHTTYDTPVIPADHIIAHHNRLLGGFSELATADQVTF